MNHIDATLSISPDISADLTMDSDLDTNANVGIIAYQSGTTNYDILENKPRIENVVLSGNKTFTQLGLEPVTPQDIDKLLYG